jgi:nitroreductase
MTDASLTKDPVSLEDLKRAIEATQRIPDDWNDHADSPGEYALALTRDAWRTAFEWREGWSQRFSEQHADRTITTKIYVEGDEGMRLIREKLT